MERNKVLQAEYLDRLARGRTARIPPSTPELGPDWRNMASEMIERVKLLKRAFRIHLGKSNQGEGMTCSQQQG